MRQRIDSPSQVRFGARASRWSLSVLACCLLIAGCEDGPQGPPRVDTFPIKGKLTIDGNPEVGVAVKLNPVGKEVSAANVNSSTFTDADGAFTIGTYESGDGAPEGDYTLTFMWGTRSLVTGRYGGPDKLNERYLDPEASEVKVTVNPGEEIDLGTIELTTE